MISDFSIPIKAYLLDSNGNVVKGDVIGATINTTWNETPTMSIECNHITYCIKPDYKDIDSDVFQAMLKDGYGTGNSEVQKESAEETA